MSYTPNLPAEAGKPRTPLLIGVLIGLLAGWGLVGLIRGGANGRDAAPRAITPRGELSEQEKTTTGIFEEAAPSVVHVTSLSNRREVIGFRIYETPQQGTGTGFIWDDSGHVVTNFHVIQGAERIKVHLADHSNWDAVVIGAEPDKDLAVLQIDAPSSQLKPIAVGTSKDLRVGQTVLAIGNPFGLDQSLTTGVVSALGRTMHAVTGRIIEDVVQTDAAINPGNSGGPLLDSAGRLIGVNTMIVSQSGASAGVGFAVPVDTVNEVVPQLIKYGRIIRPELGVTIVTDARALRLLGQPTGAVVRSVAPDSGAERAGLRGFAMTRDGRLILGDVIKKIDDQPVATSDDLLTILEKHKPGDTVTVTYLRDDELRTARVQLEHTKR